MDKIAKFEINLENLENNIAEKLQEEVSSSTLEQIRESALSEINSLVISKLTPEFINHLVETKTEQIISKKLDDLFDARTENNTNLKEILFGIFANKLLKSASSSSEDIKTALENALKNANIEHYIPNAPEKSLLLKEVLMLDEDNSIYGVSIYFNEKRVLHIEEGEPEDMTINRDLNDALKIKNLITQSYEYGRAGKDLYTQNIREIF